MSERKRDTYKRYVPMRMDNNYQLYLLVIDVHIDALGAFISVQMAVVNLQILILFDDIPQYMKGKYRC